MASLHARRGRDPAAPPPPLPSPRRRPRPPSAGPAPAAGPWGPARAAAAGLVPFAVWFARPADSAEANERRLLHALRVGSSLDLATDLLHVEAILQRPDAAGRRVPRWTLWLAGAGAGAMGDRFSFGAGARRLWGHPSRAWPARQRTRRSRQAGAPRPAPATGGAAQGDAAAERARPSAAAAPAASPAATPGAAPPGAPPATAPPPPTASAILCGPQEPPACLASLNVGICINGARNEPRAERVAVALRRGIDRVGAKIVCLQETMTTGTGGNRHFLHSRFRDFHAPRVPAADHARGVSLLLSQELGPQPLDAVGADANFVAAQCAIDGRPVAVFSVYLPSPGPGTAAWGAAVQRLRRALLSVRSLEPRRELVLAGDWNASAVAVLAALGGDQRLSFLDALPFRGSSTTFFRYQGGTEEVARRLAAGPAAALPPLLASSAHDFVVASTAARHRLFGACTVRPDDFAVSRSHRLFTVPFLCAGRVAPSRGPRRGTGRSRP